MSLIYLASAILALSANSAANDISADLNATVTRRDTHTLTVEWEVIPTKAEQMMSEYRVMVVSADKAYKVTYEGPEVVDYDAKKATIPVHELDAAYTICVIGVVHSNFTELNVTNIEECMDTSTIPAIHSGSLIALLLTLLFFLLCIIAGVISWKCAIKRSSGKDEDDLDKVELNGNGDVVPLTHIED